MSVMCVMYVECIPQAMRGNATYAMYVTTVLNVCMKVCMNVIMYDRMYEYMYECMYDMYV